MELRRAGHVHFIQLIEGESVIKVLNVGRGLPPLKFKALEDVYQIEDMEIVPTVIRPKFECDDLPIDFVRVKDEPTSLLAGEKGVIYEHENSESDSIDDDLLDSMTLTQMKEMFIVKKRKCPSKDSPRKKIHFDQHNMDEDCELMESLSSFKSKISKDRKFKRKSRISSSLTSSQTALLDVKTEVIPVDEAIYQSSGSSPLPVRIKIEIPDPIEYTWDNVIPIATESSCADVVSSSVSTSTEEPDPVEEKSECVLSIVPQERSDRGSDCGFEATSSAFCDKHVLCVVNEENSAYGEQNCNDFILYERVSNETSSGDSETANSCDLGSHVSTSVSKELKFSIVSEESNDMELHNCKSNADELASHEKMVDEAPIKDSKTVNSYVLNPQVSSIISNEFQVCVVNKETDEYRKYSDPILVHAAKDSDGELMAHMAEEIGNQMPDLSVSGSKEEDTFVNPHPSEKYAETVSSSEGHISDTYNGSQSSTSSLEKLCETDITISNSIRSIELANRDDLPLSETGAKDDESHIDVSVATQPVGDCSSFYNSYSQSNTADCAVSSIDYSPSYKEKQAVESASDTFEEKESSSELQSRIDESVAEEQKHPPERLLSNRKVISPTSQKRLCEAMEFTELDVEQYYKHTRKLCYQRLSENKTSRPEKVSPIKKCETAASSIHFSQKARTEKNVVLNKGVLKDPNIPRSMPRFSTGCMSLESCSESAILFSQQQMRDFQSIANKLSRELKSMKDIVEETLRPNVDPAAPQKYSTEEVGISIHNATRVEENAKRLLSIMARDCNRFCKIMKLTDKGPATSGNVACKEKRKIVFADEAGRQLCDVKIFKHDLSSTVDSNVNRDRTNKHVKYSRD